MLKDFKAFILRGNVLDLAVGFVIGAAFTAVVSAFVADLLTPLISIPGKVNFSGLQIQVHHSIFKYGLFLNDLISFIIVAAAVFFFVVRPVSKLMERRTKGQDPETRDCPECLSEIPAKARRCAQCTAEVVPVA
jgi:large conductance mechanosensitive channel